MRGLNRRGVSLSETILILPFFLIFVFGLLQLVQLGVGLVVVNYGAGSIARKIARTSSTGVGSYTQDFTGLLTAGMKNGSVTACKDSGPGGDNVVSNTIVIAEARIDAFPFIGPLVDRAAPALKQNASAPACQDASFIPALGFTSGSGYQFIVRGKAVARRNYLQ